MPDKEIDYTKKSTYFYNLPEEMIAQNPVEPRDSSRLLVFNKGTEKIEHKKFYNIIDYLKKGDVLVINNTRVIPCRLLGIKDGTGAKIEVFIIKRLNLTDWEALVKPGKRLQVGAKVKFNDELSCEIIGHTNFGGRVVRFIYQGTFEDVLNRAGSMPLPPYIREKLKNNERYQTVYSKTNGSTAAPTAGLHFTPELLEKIKEKGIIVLEVLLHVGLGTFRPVKADNILDHDMHSEYFEVTEEVANQINKAKEEGRRIIAVGTYPRFPFVYRLSGDTELVGKLILRQTVFSAQSKYFFCKCHLEAPLFLLKLIISPFGQKNK